MILIYAESTTNRLEYVCEFVFKRVMNTEFIITNSKTKFENSKEVKLNYSSDKTDGIQVIPSGLLESKTIDVIHISKGKWDDLPILFCNEETSVVPFDILSAIFFLLSRYEEYTASERDKHDRFTSQNSVLHELEILERPVVDLWCAKFYEIVFGKALQRQYKYISTIDVDNAYAYSYKSLPIKIGSTLKSLFRSDGEDVKRRLGVYFRRHQDPYDTYDFINEVHESNNAERIFFFLVSDRNVWDKNLSFTNKYYRALICALQRKNSVGIHPGYLSYLNSDVILEEKFRLEDVVQSEIKKSRQHFLRFKFPETPRNLISAGIKEDYSLGYAERLGFRAGTCTPFAFYDLEKDEVTELVFHSSALMDVTLNRYLGLNPEEAVKAAEELIKEVKEVGGELVTIWHNETLSELREWKGWSYVFKEVVSLAKSE